MANTILFGSNVSFLRENETQSLPLLVRSGLRLVQAGDAIGGSIQVATTTAANLNVGGVTTPAFAVFENKDATNYVSIGWDNAGTFEEAIRIPAGWPAIVPLSPSRTWQIKSNTASVTLYYQVMQA